MILGALLTLPIEYLFLQTHGPYEQALSQIVWGLNDHDYSHWAVFNILLALADGEKHGYAIMLEVEGNTHGAVKIGPGTLYGSIERMLASGLIEESDKRPDEALDDQLRRYYRLSGLGERALRLEAERLENQVSVARFKQVLDGAA